jgi:hypothetical protein
MLTEFGISIRTHRGWAFRKALTDGMFTVLFSTTPYRQEEIIQ